MTIIPHREKCVSPFIVINEYTLVRAFNELSRDGFLLYVGLSTVQEGVKHTDINFTNTGVSEENLAKAEEELVEKGYLERNALGSEADFDFYQMPQPKPINLKAIEPTSATPLYEFQKVVDGKIVWDF